MLVGSDYTDALVWLYDSVLVITNRIATVAKKAHML